jgi:hypothetical protein
MLDKWDGVNEAPLRTLILARTLLVTYRSVDDHVGFGTANCGR